MKRSGPLRRRAPIKRSSKRRRSETPAYQRWAIAVKTRDRHCQWEGCFIQVLLEAHHVYPQGTHPRLRFVLENGLALCREHHVKWHSQPRASRIQWAARYPERAAVIAKLLRQPRLQPLGDLLRPVVEPVRDQLRQDQVEDDIDPSATGGGVQN